jgi:predicted TIM-barrel fold metal-dependent hydrolase
MPIGVVDCDIHPAVPGLDTLLPYLPGHWADTAVQRGITDLNTASYPDHAPITARPDWLPEKGRAGTDLALLKAQALDHWKVSAAICNCLYGVQTLFSADMAAGFATAVNTWLARDWLDKDSRLRASIVVPLQNPDLAVDEIERWAGDRRFVQVLLPVFSDMPLGNRHYWPIFAAAERHGLPVGIHAGSTYRHPVTSAGWPSYYIEDYVAQAQGFQSQLASLICEGTFAKFPALKVVFIESGFTWMPAALWRLNKYWQGLRMEIPWVDRQPSKIARDHIRLTLQPVDSAPDPKDFERFMNHMESDEMLLFSTDYPHWQFDGDEAIPEGFSPDLVRKIQIDNPHSTYSRLTEAAS